MVKQVNVWLQQSWLNELLAAKAGSRIGCVYATLLLRIIGACEPALSLQGWDCTDVHDCGLLSN